MWLCLLLVAGAATLPRPQGGDLIRSGWEAEEAWARGGQQTARRQVTRRQGRGGSIVGGESAAPDDGQQQGQLQYLARRPTTQVTLGEAGRRGRTGYGFTRDSLEDLGPQPQRRSRGGPSLKQGRSRPVPQILELEEDGEEYDGEYDEYDDEYAYSDEEEEELVWPHEVRPARTRAEPRYPPATTTRKPNYSPAQQYPRREEEVEGRRSFPQVSSPPQRRQPPARQPGGQGEGYRRGTEEMVEEEDEEEEEGCGPECRNLLHEVEHPKEDERCPDPTMVIDIWGYCRHIFQEERRDWSWWENLRQYVHANGNSGVNNYRPAIPEHAPWPGTWHSG